MAAIWLSQSDFLYNQNSTALHSAVVMAQKIRLRGDNIDLDDVVDLGEHIKRSRQ